MIENLQEKLHQRERNFLENLNPKEDSSKSTLSKVLSKIPNLRKTFKQQYNFCKTKISLEVHGM